MAINFGRFSLDPREYRLARNGSAIAVPPKPFDLLVALASSAGQLLSREELLRMVWKDVVVEQSSLNAAMSVLRQALGDDAAATIETVPGRGYRFIAAMADSTPAAPTANPATATRVAIVDDHAVVRLGVRALVERAAGFVVIGEAGSLDDAGVMIEANRPDLLILDLVLGDESSLPRIKHWRSTSPGLRVIVLSMHDEDEYARTAIAAGAHGFVMKSEMSGELATAIAAVSAGEIWVSLKLSQAILKEFAEKASR